MYSYCTRNPISVKSHFNLSSKNNPEYLQKKKSFDDVTINKSITINCKAPEYPKINGGFSGLADATSPNDRRCDPFEVWM